MGIVAVDTETTGLNLFHRDAPFMVTTMDEEGVSSIWQWDVNPFTREVMAPREILEEIADYLAGKELVFHHAKYDLRALAKIGLNITSIFPAFHAKSPTPIFNRGWYVGTIVKAIHDTQLLSHVCNSQGADGHALKPLALLYLDYPEDDEKALRKAVVASRRIGKKLGWKLGVDLHGEPQPGMDYWMPRACWEARHGQTASLDESYDIPMEWLDICEKYAIGDVHRTIGLFFYLQEVLEREGLEANYHRELRLIPATYMMEHVGMHVYRENLDSTLKEFKEKSVEYKAKAETILMGLGGREHLNVNSAPQLSSVLGSIGYPLCRRTAPSKSYPDGQWAMDAETIRSLAQYGESELPLPNTRRSPGLKQAAEALRLIAGWHPDDGDDVEIAIPGYKTFGTGVSYCTNYKDLLTEDNLLHPSYLQVGTAWTRYSCTEPNGQNISTKAVLPLRKFFGPPPAYVWLCVDYAQLELRIFAYAARDAKLIAALSGGKDFHAETACQLYGLAPDQISKEQRTIAKNVNFGIIYGAGPKKIDATTGKPGTYQLYISKFPDARDFMKRAIVLVEADGYTHTLSGYRLVVPSNKSYAVVNAIVQGTAGCIVKNAMIEMHERGLVDWEPPSKDLPYGGSAMVGNIHDEIIFQFPKSYPYRAIGKRIMKVMESHGEKLGCVTPADAKLITKSWAEGEKFI